jgi:glycosyltransferase involved in cell wall biosynthesis
MDDLITASDQRVERPIRVAIQQYSLASYNEAIFARLSAAPGYEFVIIHGKNRRADASPGPTHLVPFRTWHVTNREISILGFELRFQFGLVGAIARGGYDVVIFEGTFGIISNWIGALYCRTKRIPFMWWACGWEKQTEGMWRNVKSWFVSCLVKAAPYNIAYGTVAEKYLVEHGAPGDRVIIAQNTIDTSVIFAESVSLMESGKGLRAHLGLVGKKVVLFVGRLTEAKRLDLLLGAFKTVASRLPGLALVIVGNGSEKERLRRLVQDEELRDVIFIDGTYDDVNPYFAACDVFVLPGLGGLAINQAMAFGKPVISGPADGTEKDLIIDGENGYLLGTRTSDELAERLLTILEDDNLRARMGTASADIIRNKATIEMMRDNILRAVNLSVLATPKRSAPL